MPRKQTRAIAEPTEIQTQSEEMNDTQAVGIDEGENSPQTDSENADSQRIPSVPLSELFRVFNGVHHCDEAFDSRFLHLD